MKVKNILDYFGPVINCRTKFRYENQDNYVFQTTGKNFSDDEAFLESYILEMNLKLDHDGHFVEFVIKDGIM